MVQNGLGRTGRKGFCCCRRRSPGTTEGADERPVAQPAVAVNQELILLYWGLGGRFFRARREGSRLSRDLAFEFAEIKGLSPRKLGYLEFFAKAWPEGSIVQQAVAQLP